jgi:hypothetical protein
MFSRTAFNLSSWPLSHRDDYVGRAGLFYTSRDWGSLRLEVTIGVATLYEFATYSSHKADDDFHYCCGALRAGHGPFMSFDSGISLMVVLCL